MRSIVLLAALLSVPASAQQPAPALTLEQKMLLRCSAAFAVVAGEQERGVASAQAYPPLRERGREFFVRAIARLMDEQNLSREQAEAAVRSEAQRFQADAAQAPDKARFLDGMMQPCLAALGAAGL